MSGWLEKLNGFLKDSVTALQVQRDFFVVYDYAGKGIQKRRLEGKSMQFSEIVKFLVGKNGIYLFCIFSFLELLLLNYH